MLETVPRLGRTDVIFNTVPSNLVFIEGNISSLYFKEFQELNLVEEGNSSLGLKAEVSLPFM